MRLEEIIDGFRSLNLNAIFLATRRPSGLRSYISHCAKKYDEVLGNGLPRQSPIDPPTEDLVITLPAAHSGGGMSFSEMAILARATKVLKPSAIFEIGTFNGQTTAIFILNSDPATRVFTLDLPDDSKGNEHYLSSDAQLVAVRRLGAAPRALGLNNYVQIYCDSMSFDPSDYIESIDLCLIDGAHDLAHVKNDTIKVASMISDAGTVFWHDYGGKGSMRALTEYLDFLGTKAQIFRVPDTSLAWARGYDLKRAIGHKKESRDNSRRAN